MTPLRKRCIEFLEKKPIAQPAVDLLVEFVMSEIGRSADARLEGAKSLILYFEDETGRQEFVAMVCEALPGLRAREIP